MAVDLPVAIPPVSPSGRHDAPARADKSSCNSSSNGSSSSSVGGAEKTLSYTKAALPAVALAVPVAVPVVAFAVIVVAAVVIIKVNVMAARPETAPTRASRRACKGDKIPAKNPTKHKRVDATSVNTKAGLKYNSTKLSSSSGANICIIRMYSYHLQNCRKNAGSVSPIART